MSTTYSARLLRETGTTCPGNAGQSPSSVVYLNSENHRVALSGMVVLSTSHIENIARAGQDVTVLCYAIPESVVCLDSTRFDNGICFFGAANMLILLP